MSFAVSTSMASQGESGRIVQVEKLSPSPQCKVLTVSLFVFFKLFGRLPVISFSELLLVRHIFAPDKETPQVWESEHQCLSGWLMKRPAGKVGWNPLFRQKSGRKTFLPSMSYHSGTISAIKWVTRWQQSSFY